MGFFSWLFGKKRNNEPLRQYLGSDVEPEAEKPKKKAKRKKKKTAEEESNLNIQSADIPVVSDGEKELTETERVATDENDTDEKSSGKSGYFDLKKSKDGRYVFTLYAANRVIIAASRVYSSSRSALGGINSVISTADKATIERDLLALGGAVMGIGDAGGGQEVLTAVLRKVQGDARVAPVPLRGQGHRVLRGLLVGGAVEGKILIGLAGRLHRHLLGCGLGGGGVSPGGIAHGVGGGLCGGRGLTGGSGEGQSGQQEGCDAGGGSHEGGSFLFRVGDRAGRGGRCASRVYVREIAGRRPDARRCGRHRHRWGGGRRA